MKRLVLIPGLMTLVAATACGDQPASPSGLLASSGAVQTAKPGSGGPTASAHDLTFGPSMFGDPGSDGYPSPGHIQAASPATGLQGWITGPNASGWYKASATGAYSLLITDVSDVPGEPGDPCTEAQQTTLRSHGVLATAVSGSFALTIGQTTGGTVNPNLNWDLTNIVTAPGFTWQIHGRSGSTNPLFFPQFDPSSTTTALTVTVENSVIDFQRYPNGARKPDLIVGKCRADFTMQLTRR